MGCAYYSFKDRETYLILDKTPLDAVMEEHAGGNGIVINWTDDGVIVKYVRDFEIQPENFMFTEFSFILCPNTREV